MSTIRELIKKWRDDVCDCTSDVHPINHRAVMARLGAIEKAAEALEADRKRESVTDCNALNGAKCREALESIVNNLENRLFSRYPCSATDVWMLQKARSALSEPPRNCDIMSLETARKVWFAKEIVPRLFGDLPRGGEVPFEKWFVSQQEQGEAK